MLRLKICSNVVEIVPWSEAGGAVPVNTVSALALAWLSQYQSVTLVTKWALKMK